VTALKESEKHAQFGKKSSTICNLVLNYGLCFAIAIKQGKIPSIQM